MELYNNQDRMLSPEDMKKIEEALQVLTSHVKDLQQRFLEAAQESRADVELQPDVYNEIANKHRTTKVRQFQARPLNKQAVIASQMEEVRTQIKNLLQMMEDTKLVLEMRMMERAKKVHEALREASKTDPSLEAAVREMDELYQQAQGEDQEDATPEDKS